MGSISDGIQEGEIENRKNFFWNFGKSVMFVILAVGVPLKVIERGLYIVFFTDNRVILSEFIEEGFIEGTFFVAIA